MICSFTMNNLAQNTMARSITSPSSSLMGKVLKLIFQAQKSKLLIVDNSHMERNKVMANKLKKIQSMKVSGLTIKKMEWGYNLL